MWTPTPDSTLAEWTAYAKTLPPDEQLALARVAMQNQGLWSHLPGSPQEQALLSPADIVFFGGAAGGGKTDLVIGMSMTEHRRSIIFRREGTQLQGVIDRIAEVTGGRDGYNGQERIWRYPDGRVLELGSVPNPGDEMKYQGRPHDLAAFDEITHFSEEVFRFLIGWLRTTTVGQRTRVICTGNPPTTAEGAWVRSFWAPWLDTRHPLYGGVKPGQLLWYATIDGQDTPVFDGSPFEHDGELVTPKSRTFIPSFVEDNPYLMHTGYKSQLQALPEPLRSQMLRGDFTAGLGDQDMQVIPSSWIEDAMGRWVDRVDLRGLDALGVDVARGGDDQTVLTPRHGFWFGRQHVYPGSATPTGQVVAGLCIQHGRPGCRYLVDAIGVGASAVDHLAETDVQAVVSSAAGYGTDRSGSLSFSNYRTRIWWKFREMLDPAHEHKVSIAPNDDVLRELSAPVFKVMSGKKIQVEPKEDTKKRLGYSPDRGDSIVYASIDAEPSVMLERPKAPASGGYGYQREAGRDRQLGWGTFNAPIKYDDTGVV